MGKVIVIDLGSIIHAAIFSNYSQLQKQKEGKIPENSFTPPASYNFMNSLISMLKRIGVDKDKDTVILAGDGRNSFRKAFDKQYKAQRQDYRETFDIDWTKEYAKMNKVIHQLAEATNFHLIWESKVWNGLDLIATPEGEKYLNIEDINLDEEWAYEADDIASVTCKVFADKEIILVTKDNDWSMLCTKDNVKFFSMNVKWKGGTGVYKPIDNAYKVLDGKIRKGDKSDNIIIPENDTPRDAEIRKLIIDLISLPVFVENAIRPKLENLPKKIADFTKLPFPNSLAKRFPDIYKTDKIINYEECVKRLERKKVRAKNKKIKQKKELTLRKEK